MEISKLFKELQGWKKAVFILLCFFGVGGLLKELTPPESPRTQKAIPSKTSLSEKKAESTKKNYQIIAYNCVEAIKANLHDPSSAQLPDAVSIYDYPSKFYVGENKNGVVTVQFEMRAKNSFNALRRSTAECQFKRTKDGYSLIKIHNF